MGRLLQAIDSDLVRDGKDGTATYGGTLDEEWAIGTVVHGGVSLSLVMNAVCQFMRLPEQESNGIKHHDPQHIAGSMLAAAAIGTPFEIDITLIKKGRGFSTLEAKLTQPNKGKPQVRVYAMVIMTNFAARYADPAAVPTLKFGDPLYAQCPIPPLAESTRTHHWPKESKVRMAARLREQLKPGYRREAREKHKRLLAARWIEVVDPERNNDLEAIPQSPPASGGGSSSKATAGGYKGGDTMCVFADWGENSVTLLPGESAGGANLWLPTLQITVEYKRAFNFKDPVMRCGIFSSGRFVEHGQHELDNEVWSHPADAAKFGLPPGQETTILCISRQIASTLDMSINLKQNAVKAAAAKL